MKLRAHDSNRSGLIDYLATTTDQTIALTWMEVPARLLHSLAGMLERVEPGVNMYLYIWFDIACIVLFLACLPVGDSKTL